MRVRVERLFGFAGLAESGLLLKSAQFSIFGGGWLCRSSGLGRTLLRSSLTALSQSSSLVSGVSFLRVVDCWNIRVAVHTWRIFDQGFSSKTVRGAVIRVLLLTEGFGFGSAIANCRGCHTVGRLALMCLFAWDLPQSPSFVRGGRLYCGVD